MPQYHTLPKVAQVKDAAVKAITSPLAFKVYRTFIVTFAAVWATLDNALSVNAVVAAASAAGTAVLNGYVVPAWREYKGKE